MLFLVCILNANWADFRLVQVIVAMKYNDTLNLPRGDLLFYLEDETCTFSHSEKIWVNCLVKYTVFCSILPLASALCVTFKLKGICVALHGMIYEKEVSYLINCKSLRQLYFPFLAFISIDLEGSKTRHMGGSKIFSYSHLDESPDFCLRFWTPEHYSSPDVRVRRLHTCVSRCDLAVYPRAKW